MRYHFCSYDLSSVRYREFILCLASQARRQTASKSSCRFRRVRAWRMSYPVQDIRIHDPALSCCRMFLSNLCILTYLPLSMIFLCKLSEAQAGAFPHRCFLSIYARSSLFPLRYLFFLHYFQKVYCNPAIRGCLPPPLRSHGRIPSWHRCCLPGSVLPPQ